MTGQAFPYRRFPCNECPIRVDNADNPASQFPGWKWRELTVSVVDPDTGFGPDFNAPMFGCHKGEPGTNADLACAGWLARFGLDHPNVRLALVVGTLPASALTPGGNWPPLHRRWVDVVAAHTSDQPDGGETHACPATIKPIHGTAFAVGPSEKDGRR